MILVCNGLRCYDSATPNPLASNIMLEELLLSYYELRSYLTRKLRNTDDAADIAQSSFERVYAHSQNTASPDNLILSPRALLFQTANNICIDIARHQRITRAWEEDRKNQGDQYASSTQDQVEYRQLLQRVIAILDALPPRQREVFLLFKVYGYSRLEIAQRLSISEAAVAKHVVRATLCCSKLFADLHAYPSVRSQSKAQNSYGTPAARYSAA